MHRSASITQAILRQLRNFLAAIWAGRVLARRITRDVLGDPHSRVSFVGGEPPLLRGVVFRDAGRRGLEACAARARAPRVRSRGGRKDASLGRRPTALILARIGAAGGRTLRCTVGGASIELADAVDVSGGQLLRIVVHVGAVKQGQGPGLGEGVVPVEHDALEVESSSVLGHGVLKVVVTEIGCELTRPAATVISRRSTAALSVGGRGLESKRIVDQV